MANKRSALSFTSIRNIHKCSVHTNVMDSLDLEVLTSQLSTWECLRSKSLLGSPKDSWHPKGREGGKCSCFFPFLLCISSAGMFCCNPSYFNAITCHLFLFAVLPQSGVQPNNFGHAFCYLIWRCHVRVLNSSFDLILQVFHSQPSE